MEEVAAGQAAGGNRRSAAKVSRRRRAGRRTSEEEAADDTTGAGEGGNRPSADTRAEDEDDEPDDKYLERISGPLLARSTLLVFAKARPFIFPPAWLSRAREAAAAGEPELLAARLYQFLSTVSAAQDGAIAIELCLFDLKLVSAGRALTAVERFTVVGLVSAVAALAAAVVGAGASGDWHEAAATALLPLVPAAPAAVSFVLGKLKELVGEMFRG